MKEVNYEMLLEDIEFPLQRDSISVYVTDNQHHMVANYLTFASVSSVSSKILGDMKQFEGKTSTDKCYVDRGCIRYKETGMSLLLVRGWGRLQYKDNPEIRQENISNYLLNCLNL
jgi:hypothetical protein